MLPELHLRETETGVQSAMKFFLAILAYLFISLLLGWGILLAVKGQPWLLVVSILVYTISFAKIGCLPGKSH